VVEVVSVGIEAQVGQVGTLERTVVASGEAIVVVVVEIREVVRTGLQRVRLLEQEHSSLVDTVLTEERSCTLSLRGEVDWEGLGMPKG